MLGCFTKLVNRELYIAHDDDGDPGMGRSPDADGDRLDMLKNQAPVVIHHKEKSIIGLMSSEEAWGRKL